MITSLRKTNFYDFELVFKDYIPNPTNLIAKETTVEIIENSIVLFSIGFVKGIDDYDDAESNIENLVSIKIQEIQVIKGFLGFLDSFLRRQKSLPLKYIVVLKFAKTYQFISKLDFKNSQIIFHVEHSTPN